jgi:hypothetical protein
MIYKMRLGKIAQQIYRSISTFREIIKSAIRSESTITVRIHKIPNLQRYTALTAPNNVFATNTRLFLSKNNLVVFFF